METLGTTVEVVIIFKKYILSPIMNQLSYLFSYSGNIKSLRDQVEKLKKKRSDLQLEVDDARRNTRIIASTVDEWIKDVENITNKMENEITEEQAEVKKGCFYGIFPNMKLRYSLSKKAKKMDADARGLLQNEGIINKISHPAPLEPIPSASSVTEIDSRKSKEDEIMVALNDNNVYVIALCGMGGVGKTTMAKTVKNKVEKGKIFEEVAMVVVSRPLDLKNVQQGIAEGVGLKLEEQTIEARAQRLHQRLKVSGGILIILDDVWEEFNLEDIGIPSKATHQGCKVILTSRNQHICRTIEVSAKIINLDILSEHEAWNLFKEKSGEIVDEEKIHPIAREVARECKGLPLALVTVAAALRDSSLPSWEDALNQLKASIVTNIPEVHRKVYAPLKLSYDQIGNVEARYLFLLCCFFPEDYEIPLHVLVEYGFSLRMFVNTINLEEERNRVYRLVEMLIDRFLLIRVDLRKNIGIKNDHYMKFRVKIHDVLRDMGISIASEDRHNFMAIHDPNLREWPKKDFDYGNYTHISLWSSMTVSLQEKIYCPRLELLRVDGNVVEVQESSFDNMQGLRVLHISQLRSLPSSLSWAKNLRSLILTGDLRTRLPNEIVECENLEILRVFWIGNWGVPEEIWKLKKLKLLELKNFLNPLQKIQPGAISGLVQLEELYINQFRNWKRKEFDMQANVGEVLSLKCLHTLELQVDITSLELIPLQINENLSKLKRYYVYIGMEYLPMNDRANLERCIMMRLSTPKYFTNLIQILFDNAQAISLSGEGTTEMAQKLSRQGYKEVEMLELEYLGLEFLFDSSSWNLPDVKYFPRLTTLTLEKNKVLKEICNGQPPNGSFSNLRTILLKYCSALSYLFSFSIVAMLSKLESLQIWGCKSMEGVFSEEKGQGSNNEEKKIINTITLPRLSKIKLMLLPRLGALFWSTEDFTIELPKLCEVEIGKCSSLRSFRVVESCFIPTDSKETKAKQQYLIDSKVIICGLKNLRLHGIYFSEMFDPRIPMNIMSLESLHIRECTGFVGWFSNSISKAMHNLRDLYISRVEMLQEVIAKEKDEPTSFKVITLFPQLKFLKLLHLPRMSQFCHASDHGVELLSLEYLTLIYCEVMETFCRNQFHLQNSQGSDSITVTDDHSFFDEVMCIKLKELKMRDLKTITRIFGPKIIYGNFSSLQIVNIMSCDRLRCIFSFPMFSGLVNLQKLILSSCPELEEVIPKEEKEPQFPLLKTLYLIDLPKIVKVFHTKNFLDLPSLERLSIKGCSNLKSFCTIDTEEEQSLFHQKVRNFFRLDTFELSGCSGIIYLFPNYAFVKSRISNLRNFSISDYEMLQEVIGKKYEEEQINFGIILFPKLCRLKLFNLQSIKQFCRLNLNIEFPSLEEVEISHCEVMETFSQCPTDYLSNSEVKDSNVVTESFFTEVTCNKLKEMKVKVIKGAEELFGRKISVGSFNNLESLVISQCERLRSICSHTVCKGLVNLQELKIERCPELQEVISKDEKDVETTPMEKEIIFPELKTLHLDYLPKLVRIFHIKNDLELPKLYNLEVISCHVLETLSLGSVYLLRRVEIYESLRRLEKGELEKFLNKFNCQLILTGGGLSTELVGENSINEY